MRLDLERLWRFVRRGRARSIRSVGTRLAVVALTFDDGPDPVFTPALLEVLRRHRAHATFFMVGRAARDHPAVVRQVAEAGHAIGNHTWSHPSLDQVDRARCRDEILACEEILSPYSSLLLRPPFGRIGSAVKAEAGALGYTIVRWNVSAEDWIGHEAGAIAARVGAALHPGAIALFHDGLADPLDPAFRDRSATIEAVDRLLGAWSTRFRFVTVPELLQCGEGRSEYGTPEGRAISRSPR